ncbi:hypothetical protein E4U43_000197 [Claviceps pusilla]|uniref:Uncharacterized protein n=1 Tax=Claviceps pusilla TaxID=123648 RepID=A0A9P7T094_9HYPO|nr:hypothetical protein E4U43_000197 [Claviceps pusilla]
MGCNSSLSSTHSHLAPAAVGNEQQQLTGWTKQTASDAHDVHDADALVRSDTIATAIKDPGHTRRLRVLTLRALATQSGRAWDKEKAKESTSELAQARPFPAGESRRWGGDVNFQVVWCFMVDVKGLNPQVRTKVADVLWRRDVPGLNSFGWRHV